MKQVENYKKHEKIVAGNRAKVVDYTFVAENQSMMMVAETPVKYGE
jgi:hypothetical protein